MMKQYVSALEFGFREAIAEARASKRYSLETPLRLVLAVSGGRDSMVLMSTAEELAAELNLVLEVVHVDHGLRPSSVEEAAFVQEAAGVKHIPVHIYTAKSRPPQTNMEAWAREIRYQHLEFHRNAVDAEFVVTAHHLQDQVETLLMRLAAARSNVTIARLDPKRHLLRPFLNVSPQEFTAYCAKRNVVFLVDESNFDLRLLRSRVRHQLIPIVEQVFGEGVLKRLGESASRLNEDDQALRRVSETISPPSLRAIHWRKLRAEACLILGDNVERVSRIQWERLSESLGSGKQGKFELGHGVVAYLNKGIVSFLPSPDPVSFEASEISIPGTLSLPSGVLHATRVSRLELVAGNHPSSAYFSPTVLAGGALGVRHRLPGDKVRVMKRGSRQLKKLLQEKEIPQHLRRYYPVIVDQTGQILWVPLVARSSAFPVLDTDESVVALHFTAAN